MKKNKHYEMVQEIANMATQMGVLHDPKFKADLKRATSKNRARAERYTLRTEGKLQFLAMRTAIEKQVPRWPFIEEAAHRLDLGQEMITRRVIQMHKDILRRGVMLINGSSREDLLCYVASIIEQLGEQHVITYLIDLRGEGSRFLPTFPGASHVTHQHLPPKWFVPVGTSLNHTFEILSDIKGGTRDNIVDSFSRIQPLLPSKPSLDQVITFLEGEAKKTKSTKPTTAVQQLVVWKPILGDMAYAGDGPEIDDRHSLVAIGLSQIPLDYARRWLSAWIYRQFAIGMAAPFERIERTLVILQGDLLFSKEFAGATGSAELPLSKRVLDLQSVGWRIIILSQQVSELDQSIRNACAIPVCFAANHRDAREQLRLLRLDDPELVGGMTSLPRKRGMLMFEGSSHPAEFIRPDFTFANPMTDAEIARAMQPHWDWIRQNTTFSNASSEKESVAAKYVPVKGADNRLSANYRALLSIIEEHPGKQTKELADLSGIKLATVYKILGKSLERDFVDIEHGETTEQGGKPPQLYFITNKGKELLHGRET